MSAMHLKGELNKNSNLPVALDDADHHSPSRYEVLVRRLYRIPFFHPMNRGLHNITTLTQKFNLLDRSDLLTVHIAGSNGKGSVAIKIAKALESSGLKTGLFVSPHVSCFRERIQVNRILISESQVEDLLPPIFSACEREDIPATFFEVTTALAFAHFMTEKVEAIVLETGLGGRLDATNVIRFPALSVITSIGLEHTQILGKTLVEIAKEKSGIIKSGRPVLVGTRVPHDIIRRIADEKGSDFFTCEELLHESRPSTRSLSSFAPEDLTEDYDIENSRIAWASLELLQNSRQIPVLTPQQIAKALSLRPPCRFETFNRKLVRAKGSDGDDCVTVVLDVAHNPPALKSLTTKLNSTFPNAPKRYVVGFSANKDVQACMEVLLSSTPCSDHGNIHLVQARHPRAASVEEIVGVSPALHAANFDGTNTNPSITVQVNKALELAATNGELLVVCGSFFVMSEARAAIGIREPRDSSYIVAPGEEKSGNDS